MLPDAPFKSEPPVSGGRFRNRRFGERTMTAQESRLQFAGGPYIRVATLCERVLQEQDGVVSLIRVVDRFTQTAAGPSVPAEMPPLTISTTLVVNLSSGQARGSYEIAFRIEHPSGLSRDIGSQGV